MQASYECPDCRETHDEPAEAALGRYVLCLDCDLERRSEHLTGAHLPAAA